MMSINNLPDAKRCLQCNKMIVARAQKLLSITHDQLLQLLQLLITFIFQMPNFFLNAQKIIQPSSWHCRRNHL